MIANVLNKTPGLFFTLMLIAFVIGTMVASILAAKKQNAPTQLPAIPTQLPAIPTQLPAVPATPTQLPAVSSK
jgi:hypothetical protein